MSKKRFTGNWGIWQNHIRFRNGMMTVSLGFLFTGDLILFLLMAPYLGVGRGGFQGVVLDNPYAEWYYNSLISEKAILMIII